MGAPTQTKRLYTDSLGGQHEAPQSTYTNPMGETVDWSPRGFYTSTGVQYKATPYSSNSRTGTLTIPNVGASGLSNILGGGTGAAGGGTPVFQTPQRGFGAAAAGYQDALGTANAALDSARGAAANSGAHITNAAADLDAARAAAGGIGTAITNINAAAAGLAPYARTIAGQGGSLLDVYRALMAGDPSVGGTVGDYLGATRDAASALDALNPDAYAAMAGADVRNNYGKALDAQNRDLARRGVSAGSGAAMSLNDQFRRALATAEASAMTRARMQGLSDRATAQTQKAGLFQGVMQNAQSAGQQGTQDFATAAGIIQKAGDMFSVAGSLGSTQTNAYANIGGVEVNLGSLDLSNEKLVQDAYQGVQAAQQAMAKFYQDTMDQTVDKYDTGSHTYQTTSYS